jgi:DNA polymerase III subunit delta
VSKGENMITLLHGSNLFAVEQAAARQLAEFIKNFGDFAVSKFDGEDHSTEQITDSLLNLPFLVEKQLIVIKNPNANKELVEALPNLLNRLDVKTDLLLIAPKLDKRSTLINHVKSVGGEVAFFEQLKPYQLVEWLKVEVSERGGKINHESANYLVERLAGNQQLLYSELEKLLIYSSDISLQSIDLLTEPNPKTTIFNLIDAAFAKKYSRALEIYDEQRSLQVEPLAIMGLITWQLFNLAVAKLNPDVSADELASEYGVSSFAIKKSKQLASNISVKKIASLTNDLADLEHKLKTSVVDADEALKAFLLSV